MLSGILAMSEAEIRRIVALSKPGQMSGDPISTEKLVWCTHAIPARRKTRRIVVQTALGKSMTQSEY
jgi:hypothetical protein